MRGLSDLHRHLDGSLRRATLEEFADAEGLAVPADLAFRAGMGLQEALARFAFTLSLLQAPERVACVASEICEDAESEGVTTLEIRFAPQLHRGADVGTLVDAALQGIAGRAGLVLCGLYGEPPSVLQVLVAEGARRGGVVGIDLAGGPTPTHAFGMLDYAPAFRLAADHGLGRTVHAGEGRPAEEIRTAIDALGAERIGHGTTVLDDAAVAALVVERGVTIEACPTSNVHTGVIASVASHPLRTWIQRGIRCCVNTDNTLLSDVTLPAELDRTRAALGLDDREIAALVDAGHRAGFRR